MRVDSNTRGHTNWFYFSISNGESIGKVSINICNFRREKSLYQRVRPHSLRDYGHIYARPIKNGGRAALQ